MPRILGNKRERREGERRKGDKEGGERHTIYLLTWLSLQCF
jgi:hypothetical protein